MSKITNDWYNVPIWQQYASKGNDLLNAFYNEAQKLTAIVIWLYSLLLLFSVYLFSVFIRSPCSLYVYCFHSISQLLHVETFAVQKTCCSVTNRWTDRQADKQHYNISFCVASFTNAPQKPNSFDCMTISTIPIWRSMLLCM